jgi:hypothetical protein
MSRSAVRAASGTPSAVVHEPEPRLSRRDWLVLAIVTAVVFLLPLRALLHASGPAMEEGFMLTFPERVLHGAIPNDDFLYLYGPGSLWMLAAVYKVFGVHLVVERLVGLGQLVGMAAGAALLVRWWGRWVAVSAVVLSAMFVLPALQLTAIPWTGGVALALGAVVALVQARRDACAGASVTALRWAATGGVLAGVALLFRIDLIVAVGLAGAAALWGLARPYIRRALVGFAVGLAPYVVHLALAGPGNVARGMVIDPILHLRAARRLPVPPDPDRLEGVARVIVAVDRWWPFPRLSAPRQLFVWFVVLAVLTVALVVFAAWDVRRAPAKLPPRALLAGALFGVGMFPQAVQRADSAHFAWVSAVVVVLVPAAIVEATSTGRRTGSIGRRRASPAWIGAVAGAAVIIFTSLLLPTYTARRYVALVQDSAGAQNTIAIENDGRTFYVGSDPQFAQSITRLLAAVEREVEPGGRIIVGNTDMRRVPYVDSFLYYLLPHYKPGTAFIEFEPGLTNRAGTSLTSDMEHADAFIASDRWLTWDEPNTSMKPGAAGPAEVLRRRFCLDDDFGNGYKLFLPCRTAAEGDH